MVRTLSTYLFVKRKLTPALLGEIVRHGVTALEIFCARAHFNYHSLDAVREIAKKVKAGVLDQADITEKVFEQHLYTRNLPDPDLLIRTSGEMRVSNFLLWQISYTELVVTNTLWPDFRKAQFYAALEEYNRRHRRFGGL